MDQAIHGLDAQLAVSLPLGVYRVDHQLSDEIVTWPEVLSANEVYTAGISANIVMGNALSNFAQGFDHFVEPP